MLSIIVWGEKVKQNVLVLQITSFITCSLYFFILIKILGPLIQACSFNDILFSKLQTREFLEK
jgi:hypothetical protein